MIRLTLLTVFFVASVIVFALVFAQASTGNQTSPTGKAPAARSSGPLKPTPPSELPGGCDRCPLPSN